MKRGRKMAAPWWGLMLLFMVLVVHDVEGDASAEMPPLKNYTMNFAKLDSRHVKRILAFGDSLTEGYLAGGQKFYPYTTKLEQKLNCHFNYTRFEVLNEGISGECAFKELVTRMPKVLAREKKRVSLVIILGGTNDFRKLDCPTKDNVAHEIISLHNMVHRAGLKSVVVTIPECSDLNTECERARVVANRRLRVYVRRNKDKTLLCDLDKDLPMRSLYDFDRKVYWDDTVHPSKIGYDKIADLLFNVIRPTLEASTKLMMETTTNLIPAYSSTPNSPQHPRLATMNATSSTPSYTPMSTLMKAPAYNAPAVNTSSVSASRTPVSTPENTGTAETTHTVVNKENIYGNLDWNLEDSYNFNTSQSVNPYK